MIKYLLIFLGVIAFLVLLFSFFAYREWKVLKKIMEKEEKDLTKKELEKLNTFAAAVERRKQKIAKSQAQEMKVIHNRNKDNKNNQNKDALGREQKRVSEEDIASLFNQLLKAKSSGQSDRSIIDITEESFDLKAFFKQEMLRFNETHPSYNTHWSEKFKTKLSEDEMEFLERVLQPNNVFAKIPFCLDELVKFYLEMCKRLNLLYVEEKSTLDECTETIAVWVTREEGNDMNSPWITDIAGKIEKDIYNCIFKFCENELREVYGHTRKLQIDSHYRGNVDLKKVLNEVIVKMEKIASELRKDLPQADDELEKTLNNLNKTRGKKKLKELIDSFDGELAQFVEAVEKLERTNEDRETHKKIFFDASKFIAKKDKITALKFYLKYTRYDIKVSPVSNKKLPKTTKKALFANEKQENDFQAIVEQFKKDGNFEKAVEALSAIYKVERKKITLDQSKIEQVKEQHSGTVDLLNEYLQEEEGTMEGLPIAKNKSKAKKSKIKEEAVTSPPKSKYKQELQLNKTQIDLIELFVDHSFTVSQKVLEEFAQTNGLFKNQVIDQINEACQELIEDVLIEEEDDHYAIYEEFYKMLITNDKEA